MPTKLTSKIHETPNLMSIPVQWAHAHIHTRHKTYPHSMQNLLSSSLLSKNTKIKIYRTIILPVLGSCDRASWNAG